MSEVRDLLRSYLLDLAPTLGNCPDCWGLGVTHRALSRTTAEERHGHDQIYQPMVCATCSGSTWVRLARPRFRACLGCGRIFQPVAGLGRDWMDWCTYCRRDGLAGRSFALPPHSAPPYGDHEAQPKAGRRGTLADGNATSGLGLVPGGSSGASVQGEVRTPRPAGQGRSGVPNQGARRPSPAKGPTSQRGTFTVSHPAQHDFRVLGGSGSGKHQRDQRS